MDDQNGVPERWLDFEEDACEPSQTTEQVVESPSTPRDEFQLHFEYNDDTKEIELARPYPIMSPISNNFDDLEFLYNAPRGKAEVKVINPDGTEFIIHFLSKEIIEKSSSVLATSFERNILTVYFPQTPIIALLRAIYQGDYTFCEAMIHRPIPLLLHLQVLALGSKYRMPALVEQAQTLALACLSVTEMTRALDAEDICASAKFLYTELRPHSDLREILSTYCVVNFPDVECELFRQTAFESPAFHRDLQHANFRDRFSQPHADLITKLPVCEHWIHEHDLPSWQGINDFTCQFHSLESNRRPDRRARLLSPNAASFGPASQVTTHLFNQSTQHSAPNSAHPRSSRLLLDLPVRSRWDQAISQESQTSTASRTLPLRPSGRRISTPENRVDDTPYSSCLTNPMPRNLAHDCLSMIVPTQSNFVPTMFANDSEIASPNDPEAWSQLSLRTMQLNPERVSLDPSSDSDWVEVDAHSESTTPNTGSDYELLSSDSEWSVVE